MENKMKILLAEDEDMCAKAIANFAKKLDVDIDVTGNGKDALEKAKSNAYSLILLDIWMPELNGFQTVDELRNLSGGGDLKIVALCGDPLTPEELEKHKFTSFVQKPISKTKFETLVNTYKIK